MTTTTATQTSRLLRLPQVESMTGLKRSSIYAGMRNGRFPLSVQLSARAVAWREHEVLAWLACPVAITKQAGPLPIRHSGAKGVPTRPGWFAVGAMVEHEDDDTPDICSCNPETFGQEGRSYEEQCANARLIAQSHNLLEAVRGLLIHLNACEVSDEEAAAMDYAETVITAATGG
ncbi:MAG TPA: hypothetical protein DET46_06560 [Comamonadaceae bacterium]|nr:hypothetical protein [Comamonadaceae bacterium]